MAKENKENKESKSAESKKEKQNQEIKALKEELEKSKKDYLLMMADFETFRRRTAEDRLNLIGSATQDLIKEMLPVLDACEQAFKMLSGEGQEAALEGTKLIYDKLLGLLKNKGLEVIEAQDQDFDTNFHEAVASLPAPDETLKGKVLDVTRTGYILNGKVIRYAQVVVAA
ncbi:MAG: nucleotide exchange factor GrpE [Bacteroidales bacterium]|nr:nucleotide exchange factor GrpE [Bacteroidales bacterium]